MALLTVSPSQQKQVRTAPLFFERLVRLRRFAVLAKDTGGVVHIISFAYCYIIITKSFECRQGSDSVIRAVCGIDGSSWSGIGDVALVTLGARKRFDNSQYQLSLTHTLSRTLSLKHDYSHSQLCCLPLSLSLSDSRPPTTQIVSLVAGVSVWRRWADITSHDYTRTAEMFSSSSTSTAIMASPDDLWSGADSDEEEDWKRMWERKERVTKRERVKSVVVYLCLFWQNHIIYE